MAQLTGEAVEEIFRDMVADPDDVDWEDADLVRRLNWSVKYVRREFPESQLDGTGGLYFFEDVDAVADSLNISDHYLLPMAHLCAYRYFLDDSGDERDEKLAQRHFSEANRLLGGK